MSNPASPPSSAFFRDGRVAAGILCLATLVAYRGSFAVPFLFDDTTGVANNLSIRQLARLGAVLQPPHDGSSVTARPLVNLTLAINYAFGGLNPSGYHVGNLLLHVGAALALLGLVRGTLQRPILPATVRGAATPLALAIAVLWALHPLQTESVTVVIQRTEVLVGMLYLLTIYSFMRGAQSENGGRWFAVSAGACALGMASKEVMVTAPVMVLLYDRTFFAGTFRAAWQTRRRYYLALAATWLLLGYLVVTAGGTRGAAAGFGLGVTPWAYALKQCEAIRRYVSLAGWPHPLVLDYGGEIAVDLREVIPMALVIATAAGVTIAMLRTRPAIGFAGAWFFLLLAPTSSVVPLVAQTMAEHRMYLPLAALIALAVVGAHRLAGQRAVAPLVAIALVGGVLTSQRNLLYQDDLAIWWQTIAVRPTNARARMEFANLAQRRGRYAEAIAEYRRAIEIRPEYVEANNNLGAALLRAGRAEESLAQFQKSLRMHPLPIMHFGAAQALAQLGRAADAAAEYDEAIRLKPDYTEALNNRGNVRAQMGDEAAALADYLAALAVTPNFANAHINAAASLLALHRPQEALLHAETAARLQPANALAYLKWGDVLLELKQWPDAARRYGETAQLDPGQVHAQFGMARSLANTGDLAGAIAAYERTLQLAPHAPIAHYEIGTLLETAGRIPEAVAHYEAALMDQPDYPDAAARLAALKSSAAIHAPR